MSARQYQVLLIASHPVQYSAPLFRLMAQHPQLNIEVAYCSLQGVEPGIDSEFGVEVVWDIPLLDGYLWTQVPNQSWKPGLGSFLGLVNPGLWQMISSGRFDAVVTYMGYAYASFWIAAAAAKLNQVPLLFGTDRTTLTPRDKKMWKLRLKEWLLPYIFSLADIAIPPSTATAQFLRELNVPDERIVITPFVVDNAWWTAQAAKVDRGKVREQWDIPADAAVVVFCAKLQFWKRPQDVLRAFAKASTEDAYLLYAGEGPLLEELKAEARSLGIDQQVRFLGFLNQSQLPALFTSADLFVLPSEFDPCPAVVCEAMLCGGPAIISDEIRGRFDLVHHNKTGFIYPCGDIGALAEIFRDLLPDTERIQQLRTAARERMETWSPQDNVAALVKAIEKATSYSEKGLH